MTLLVEKKAKAKFWSLKPECKLLKEVAERGREEKGNSYSWLIQSLRNVQIALNNLQKVARDIKKAQKAGSLKSRWYVLDGRAGHFEERRHGFYKWVTDLTQENYLSTIREGAKELANKAMKAHRHTGAESAKRYYSVFRALDQQIQRFETTITQGVKDLYRQGAKDTEDFEKKDIRVFEWKGHLGSYLVNTGGKIKSYADWKRDDWKEWLQWKEWNREEYERIEREIYEAIKWRKWKRENPEEAKEVEEWMREQES